MKFLFLLALTSLSFMAQAKEYKLAIITSEFDKNVTDFFVVTDEANTIESVRYKTILPNGGIKEDNNIPAHIVLEDGAVIEERDGYEAVRLELENFSLKTGGTVKLDFLYNGITGSRSFKKLLLKFEKSKFILTDLQGNFVNRIFLKANRNRVVGTVGVREIQTSAEI